MRTESRRLQDLISVGPAITRDLKRMGIRSVAELGRQNPEKLYEKLCRVTGKAQDICCLDVLRARNPQLPPQKCLWWYWSRQRKARDARS